MEKKKRSLSFLLLSLLIHGFFFAWVRWAVSTYSPSPPPKALVFVDFLNSPHQIVDQTEFNHLNPEKKTRFLSKKNQKIEKQTQAMLNGLFHQQKLSPALKPPSKPSTDPKNNRQISSISDQLKDKMSKPLQLDLSSFSNHLSFNETSKENTSQRQLKNSDWSRTMDFLPGIELGSHTLLSTQELLYYSYFSRMKKQLYLRWVQYFQRDRKLLAFKLSKNLNHQLFSTHLYALLSPTGELEDLQVTKSCGQEDIDSAALHAFMASAPFPNPPKQLILKDGYIHVRQIFHLYIQSLFSSAFNFNF